MFPLYLTVIKDIMVYITSVVRTNITDLGRQT